MPKTEDYLALDGAINEAFQASLTPWEAFRLLQSGHERFLNHLTHRRSRGNLLAATLQTALYCAEKRFPMRIYKRKYSTLQQKICWEEKGARPGLNLETDQKDIWTKKPPGQAGSTLAYLETG